MMTYPGSAQLNYFVDKYFENENTDEPQNLYFVKFYNDKVMVLPFKNKKEARKCFKGIRIKSIEMVRPSKHKKEEK